MFMSFFIATISIFLVIILFMISKLILLKKKESREFISPFECGFDPHNKIRSSFSMRFFLIMVLFLIFDIELVFILPSPITFLSTNMIEWNVILLVFIFILSFGLLKEWKDGLLEWF